MAANEDDSVYGTCAGDDGLLPEAHLDAPTHRPIEVGIAMILGLAPGPAAWSFSRPERVRASVDALAFG
jgi:hypothetical protein